MSLTQEIESRIQRFVGELNELVRKQALQAVADALGAGGGAGPVRRGPGRPRKALSAGAPAAAPARAASGGPRVRARKKGEKRTPAELLALERAVFDHVKGNPGQGIEAIGRGLSLPTSELSRPMKKMVARGDVRTQGAKRATKYFAADGASGPSAGGGKRGGRRGKKRGKKRAKKK